MAAAVFQNIAFVKKRPSNLVLPYCLMKCVINLKLFYFAPDNRHRGHTRCSSTQCCFNARLTTQWRILCALARECCSILPRVSRATVDARLFSRETVQT